MHISGHTVHTQNFTFTLGHVSAFLHTILHAYEKERDAYYDHMFLFYSTHIYMNLKRSRDWSLLQKVRKQGACSSYSYSEMI